MIQIDQNWTGRQMLSEFWDYFSPLHQTQLEEMLIVVDAKQVDVS